MLTVTTPKRRFVVSKPTKAKKTTKTNVPDLKVNFPDVHIRPSWIKSFKGCPEKYNLQYNLKQPTKPAKGFFEGNMLDAATTKIMSIYLNNPQQIKDLSLAELVETGKTAAKESYDFQLQAFYEALGAIPGFVRKFDMHIPQRFWDIVFPEWIENRIKKPIIGVQLPITFDYTHKSGIKITVRGTTDYVFEGLIADAKKTAQNPWQKKKNVDGDYLTDDEGYEKLFAKVSPEYLIQAACYMRGLKINVTELDYFVMTKEPSYQVVPIENTWGLQKTLDLYLDDYIEAHLTGEFKPNIYYEYCPSCEFKGKQCKFTSLKAKDDE